MLTAVGLSVAAAMAAPATAAAQPYPDNGPGKSTRATLAAMYPHADVKTTGNIRVVDSGGTDTAGWVTFDGIGTVEITPRPVDPAQLVYKTNVGGGTWKYGSSINSIGQKSCISYYYHPKYAHSSSVRMDVYANDWADAGQWSYARVTRYTRTTCSTYWNAGQ